MPNPVLSCPALSGLISKLRVKSRLIFKGHWDLSQQNLFCIGIKNKAHSKFLTASESIESWFLFTIKEQICRSKPPQGIHRFCSEVRFLCNDCFTKHHMLSPLAGESEFHLSDWHWVSKWKNYSEPRSETRKLPAYIWPLSVFPPLTSGIWPVCLCLCLSLCGSFGWVIWELEEAVVQSTFSLFIHLCIEKSFGEQRTNTGFLFIDAYEKIV